MKKRSFAAKSALALICALVISLTACSGGAASDGAPAGMKLASPESAEYSFYVPSNWVVDISTGVVSAYFSEADRTNVSVTAFELEDGVVTVDDYWKKYLEDFGSVFQNYVEVSCENALISEFAGKTWVYTADVTGLSYKFAQTVVIRAEVAYIVTLTALPDRYDEHFEEYSLMLNSMIFD